MTACDACRPLADLVSRLPASLLPANLEPDVLPGPGLGMGSAQMRPLSRGPGQQHPLLGYQLHQSHQLSGRGTGSMYSSGSTTSGSNSTSPSKMQAVLRTLYGADQVRAQRGWMNAVSV